LHGAGRNSKGGRDGKKVDARLRRQPSGKGFTGRKPTEKDKRESDRGWFRAATSLWRVEEAWIAAAPRWLEKRGKKVEGKGKDKFRSKKEVTRRKKVPKDSPSGGGRLRARDGKGGKGK